MAFHHTAKSPKYRLGANGPSKLAVKGPSHQTTRLMGRSGASSKSSHIVASIDAYFQSDARRHLQSCHRLEGTLFLSFCCSDHPADDSTRRTSLVSTGVCTGGLRSSHVPCLPLSTPGVPIYSGLTSCVVLYHSLALFAQYVGRHLMNRRHSTCLPEFVQYALNHVFTQ